MHGQKNSKLGK